MEALTRRSMRTPMENDSEHAGPSTEQVVKSPLEESADALAGVEGAIGASNKIRNKLPPSPAMKRSKIMKKTDYSKERSESIDQLVSVAGSLLTDSTATAAAIAESSSTAISNQSSASNFSVSLVSSSIKTEENSAMAAAAHAAVALTTSSTEIPVEEEHLSCDSNRKTQIQYNPDVPMTKEQLTAWRREMRRVRNRESAAASRRKVRDRIEELEEEVDMWKKRYEEAQERLNRAEVRKMGEGGCDEN